MEIPTSSSITIHGQLETMNDHLLLAGETLGSVLDAHNNETFNNSSRKSTNFNI